MTWWKNGLLLAAGGVAGLALAAWLESEGKSDDYDEDYDERACKNVSKADGMELQEDKVRRDAEWAMAECTTDAEREKGIRRSNRLYTGTASNPAKAWRRNHC